MVARNPLFHGRWSVKKFQATVINDIWPEMIFFSLVATMVTLVSKMTETKLQFDTGLLTVLGTVLGLTISFRTSSAYERYQDGRKMWTSITIASRNLAQMIWIHIPTERPNGPSPLECAIEKKTMVNLVQAFSVACKHFLRGESGVYYQDLFPLICVLPRYASEAQTRDNMLPLWQASDDDETPWEPKFESQPPSRTATFRGANALNQTASLPENHVRDKTKKTFDPEQALPDLEAHRPLKPARDPPQTTFADYIPFLRLFKWIGRTVARRAKPRSEIERQAKLNRRMKDLCQSNVPLEIILFLSSYSAHVMKKGLVTPAIATGITANLTALQDTFQQLERIAYTPLPFAYQAHLRLSLWLYLFFLPFQIYAKFGYLTIPGTAFATFLLVGFLEIGQEIENPFNYDLNDLDLDGFCLSVQRELHEITAHTCPEPHTFVFSAWNQPFAPTDRRSAADLIAGGNNEYQNPESKEIQPGMASLRSTLVRNWKQVDRVTRDPKNSLR
ncbi:UPF0187-domain-containing protein [Pluteus cervinus]|uniref:UPF0187-domain-containing protein n=1 Tax=Pluteus cervinus TaxID=181527 RepID=A0ACD3AKC0_9AGAR|nr:UPF0187-domain-containing protein [Pluteus cervinus]